jgi:acyl carrier protein
VNDYTMTTLQRVRDHILETAYLSDPVDLTDDTSLIDGGLVDSTGMLDVILFLESEFGITVEDRETTPQNLETIARIAAFVDRKLAASAERPGQARS